MVNPGRKHNKFSGSTTNTTKRSLWWSPPTSTVHRIDASRKGNFLFKYFSLPSIPPDLRPGCQESRCTQIKCFTRKFFKVLQCSSFPQQRGGPKNLKIRYFAVLRIRILIRSDPVFLGHPNPDPGKYRIRILYPQKDPCSLVILVKYHCLKYSFVKIIFYL